MTTIYTYDNNKWVSQTTGKPIPLDAAREMAWDEKGPDDADAIENPNYGATTEVEVPDSEPEAVTLTETEQLHIKLDAIAKALNVDLSAAMADAVTVKTTFQTRN